jgi:hypothetical protein
MLESATTHSPAGVAELADARDLKSLVPTRRVPVRSRPPAPRTDSTQVVHHESCNFEIKAVEDDPVLADLGNVLIFGYQHSWACPDHTDPCQSAASRSAELAEWGRHVSRCWSPDDGRHDTHCHQYPRDRLDHQFNPLRFVEVGRAGVAGNARRASDQRILGLSGSGFELYASARPRSIAVRSAHRGILRLMVRHLLPSRLALCAGMLSVQTIGVAAQPGTNDTIIAIYPVTTGLAHPPDTKIACTMAVGTHGAVDAIGGSMKHDRA